MTEDSFSGVVANVRQSQTKKGDRAALFDVQTKDGLVAALLFGQAFVDCAGEVLADGQEIRGTATLDSRENPPVLVVRSLVVTGPEKWPERPPPEPEP